MPPTDRFATRVALALESKQRPYLGFTSPEPPQHHVLQEPHRFAWASAFADPDAEVYTDGATVYKGIPYSHESVNHSIRQYVGGQVHTNGIESFWSTIKRAYKGTHHFYSVQHLQRYVTEFQGRHNIRDLTTAAKMANVVVGLIGKSLCYRDLTGATEAAKLRPQRPSTSSRNPRRGGGSTARLRWPRSECHPSPPARRCLSEEGYPRPIEHGKTAKEVPWCGSNRSRAWTLVTL